MSLIRSPLRRLCRSIHPHLPIRSLHTTLQHPMYDSQLSSPSDATELPKLQIPSGQDEAEITARLKQLISPKTELTATWNLVLDGAGVQRSFKFKTFSKTWVSLAQWPACDLRRLKAESWSRTGIHGKTFPTFRPSNCICKAGQNHIYLYVSIKRTNMCLLTGGTQVLFVGFPVV